MGRPEEDKLVPFLGFGGKVGVSGLLFDEMSWWVLKDVMV